MMKFNTETLRYVAALENETNAEVKDCVVEGNLIIYIVKKGDIGKAVGFKGSNVKKLETALGRNIHIIEHTDDPLEFVRSIAGKENVSNVFMDRENKKVIIETPRITKGFVIGKNGKKVKIIEELLQRHYNISGVILR